MIEEDELYHFFDIAEIFLSVQIPSNPKQCIFFKNIIKYLILILVI